MKSHSQKFLQQRKFAMVLPILVLPFITMAFWALGGGQGTPVQTTELTTGLNLELPDAHFSSEDENLDKLSIYERAEKDSAKYRSAQEGDPYFTVSSLTATKQEPIEKLKTNSPVNKLNTSVTDDPKDDAIEDKVNDKLEQLYREINKKDETSMQDKKADPVISSGNNEQFSSDVTRLEQMMEMTNQGDDTDPEMKEIQNMLDKILDIQHPERVKEKIKAQSIQSKNQVFPVKTTTKEDNISLIGNEQNRVNVHDSVFRVVAERNAFYGLEDEITMEDAEPNAIEAVIHDTQELVPGSTVKMRIATDIFINGRLIAKDQFIYGTCAISGERLTITVNSIRQDNSLFPVALAAYDLDGMEGIYIPGALTRDAAKQASSQAIQDLQLYSLDPSIGVQAASAGIEAAKGLFNKKAKLVKITVKSGYRILLKDNNANG